jgi:hypothetical protein
MAAATSDGPNAREPGNPFLSEFAIVPRLQSLLVYKQSLKIALALVTLALIPIVFGYFAGANCMLAELHPEGISSDSISVPFGFIAEPNHGIFYLIGIPVFFIMSIFFLEGAGSAFKEMANRSQLTLLTTDSNQVMDVITEIRSRNRVVFTLVLWILPAAVIGLIFWTELPVIDRKEFGWVQASVVRELENKYLKDLQIDIPEAKTRWGSERKKKSTIKSR